VIHKQDVYGINRFVLPAFVILVIIGGSNAVAVRFSNLDLPPFWGAASRFAITAIIFWFIVAIRRFQLPRGRALIGALLFGLLGVGANYAFLYWGLLTIQAGLTMVMLAFVPLITFFFAIIHGIESFRWRGLVGALIAIIGILIGIGGGIGSAPIHIPSILAVAASAACIAEGTVVLKIFPKSHPIVTNALALTVGALLLLGVSFATGEEWVLPAESDTWLAFIYLIFIGSVILFYLYLYVLARWSASATTYSFLLFPVATVLIAAWLAGEIVKMSFIAGGILVLIGVLLGAIKTPLPPTDSVQSIETTKEISSM
jgi:drug/metabolite transporter (DMT)-like permease